MREPIKPDPPLMKRIYTLYDSITLFELKGMLEAEHEIDTISEEAISKAQIVLVKGHYGDDDSIQIHTVLKSDEKEYAKDLARYEIEKAEYDVWWAENKDSITEIRKTRAVMEKKARIAELEKEIKRLKNG